MTAAPWATPEQVTELTGITVTEADIIRATATLEVNVGLIQGVERVNIHDRDLYFLRLAVSYQAGWMSDHPDLFVREDVLSASQDGESATFRNVDAHVLAPLARKALRRLSWRGARAALPGGGTPYLSDVSGDVTSESFDDSLPWVPM